MSLRPFLGEGRSEVEKGPFLFFLSPSFPLPLPPSPLLYFTLAIIIHSTLLLSLNCFLSMIVQICLWKLTDESSFFYFQVCAINAVIIILLGISMPSRVLQRALSYCFLIWSSLVILSKMIYQLRFVQADLFQHNCTDQVS